MNQISLFDAPTGQQLRDEGMKQVTTHNSEWAAEATQLMQADFALLRSNCLFTGEDFHQWMDNRGIEQPAHANAWAAVIGSQFRRWLREGVIEEAGAVIAQRPKAHRRLIRLYKKTGGVCDT